MLEAIDLNASLPKDEYNKLLPALKQRLAILQRAAKEAGRPVLIVFEGLEATGKGDSIRHTLSALDPRGFKVYRIRRDESDDTLRRPPIRPYWLRLPARGEMAIFDQSWYMRRIEERVQGKRNAKKNRINRDEILRFERQLADDGAIIVKFWLHISQKTQKRRFKKMQRSPYEGWRVNQRDWKANKQYDKWVAESDAIISATHVPHAPWHLVAATDRRHRRAFILRTIVETLEAALHDSMTARQTPNEAKPTEPATSIVQENEWGVEYSLHSRSRILDAVDMSLSLTREEYREALKSKQNRLRELVFACYAEKLPVVIVYEGWDAAGKGGNIKRLTQKLDPRGFTVIPIAAPQGDEARHHYLWRFWRALPKAGHIGIFDRSWYGRVLVERVEGFCGEEEWRRAFVEITEFERALADFNAAVIKFWLHISPEEQLRRFNERAENPHKQHKLTDEDWRNREKWDLYRRAVNDMIERTHTSYAPWVIVESDCKLHARVKTLSTLVETLEARLRVDVR